MVNILNLINAFTSFSIFLVLWVKLKQNFILKFFALLAVGNMGISHLFYGLIGMFSIFNNHTLKIYLHLLVIYLITFNYLYFKFLITKELKIKKNVLLKLIIWTLFFAFLLIDQEYKFIEWEFKKYLILALVSIYSFYYLLKIYLLLSRNLWKKVNESINDETTNESYKVHTKYLFVLISLVVFRDLQGIVMDTGICSTEYCKIINFLSLLIISTVQLTVFFRSLLNPELLYGKQYLKNVLDRQNKTKAQDIWILSANPNLLNLQDKKLEECVLKNLLKYIAIIEENKSYNKLIKKTNYSIKDLSHELSIQKSHLSFIFKYHCKLSFSNYKKLIQIKEAMRLLDSNYLVNNTIEGLSNEVGFSSYSSFYTNFKKFTGVSPHEYHTRKHYSNTAFTSDTREIFPKPSLLSPL